LDNAVTAGNSITELSAVFFSGLAELLQDETSINTGSDPMIDAVQECDATMLKMAFKDGSIINNSDEIYLQIFLNYENTMPDKNKTSYPKEKINILFLENISDTAVKHFTDSGYSNVKKLAGALSEEQLINEIKNVHLLGIRSKTKITQKVLDAAEKLQAVGCFCIGTNQVDLKAATKKGVAVFNAPYSNTRSVAELVIGSSIILIRKIIDKNNAAHKGVWMKDAAGSYELRGKTLGIIGYGNIGSQLSVLAESLGMKVIFFDTETKLPLGNASSIKSLKELVSKSDIISLHVPELPTTKNMINKSLLKNFKKGSILINYARGEVVELDSLAKALESGHLAGAAIDVFPWEPEKNGDTFTTPLQGLSNVLLTPHIGGSTLEAQNNIGEDVSSKLFNYLEKGASYGSHTVPALSLPPQEGTHRILHIHNNVPGVLSEINTTLSKHKINILAQYLTTNENIGYVVLDLDKGLSKNALELLKKVKATIKVRMLY
jgi:D-3-phosphoglycerate dehydrogenase